MASEAFEREAAARAPEEAAERLRRPSWRDPRLLVGVLIVVVSVAGVVGLVADQDRTVPVYAADRTVFVGEPLDIEDLRVVDVRLDEVADRYLSAETEPPSDLQYVTVVDEGELVPVRAVASSDPLERRAVTLEVDDALARAVEPGRTVDLWAAHGGGIGGEAESRVEQIVEAAEVAAVTESSSTFGAQSAVTVELLVDVEDLPEVLAVRSSAATLSLVPAEGGAAAPNAAAEDDGVADEDADEDADEEPEQDGAES
ncbi:CpaB family protein [Nesterenkonia suensis]